MNRLRWGMAGLILGAVVALTLPSLGQSPAPGNDASRRTVTVTGTATITSQPDEAVVSLGVQSQAARAKEAMRANSAKMSKLIRAILSTGVSRKDIATSSINLYPSFDPSGTAVTGFTAQNQVETTLRDLSKVGDVIDRAVGVGANLVSGVTFRLSDQNRGAGQALASAVRDARSKASVLASEGGAQLGQVVSIQEGSSATPPPVVEGRMATDASTPVLPPTIETQVMVTVTWALI